jgi:hypothetical protein
MKIEIYPFKGIKITEVISDDILIKETQDALNLMAESNYQDSGKIILYEKNVAPEFFDLKSGIAGEILQKFSNYKVQLAIVGDFTKYSSKSLKDFILESNRHRHINFVNSVEEAKERLVRL